MTTFSRRGFVSRDIVQFNIKQSRYSNNRNETLTNNALSRCCPTSSCVVDVSRVLSKKFSSTRTPISSDTVIEALTKQQAKELTSKLSSEERKLFLAALNESKSEETKAGYEGRHIVCLWRLQNLCC